MIPRKVFIFGGTHGNEWTGVKVVQKYATVLSQKFPDLKIEFVLSNPEAHAINRRFKDEDLNRAFQFLNEKRPHSYEHQRAHELKRLIESEPCFVIDLHTTTSAMGKTVVVSDYNPFNLELCRKISLQFSDCRIIGSPDPHKKYLASQSPYSLLIEVGPTPNGVVTASVLEGTLDLLEFLLEEISRFKAPTTGKLELYEEAQDVFYPMDERGEISGYIHADFQGKDFNPLTGTFIPFKTFSGENISMKTDEIFYPIFINEAAYYPQKLAFILCKLRTLTF